MNESLFTRDVVFMEINERNGETLSYPANAPPPHSKNKQKLLKMQSVICDLHVWSVLKFLSFHLIHSK